MKYIIKSSEPTEIIEWKNKDKMYLNGNPNWDRLKASEKNILRESIAQEQGYICCYCERRISNNDFHLEHIKPKGITQYSKFQLDYDNLLCSCLLEVKEEDDKHCGNRKGSWYDVKNFISPLSVDCEGKFKYTYDGQILPMNDKDDSAKTTICKLRLDLDKLNNLRKDAIEPFLDDNLTDQERIDFVNGYLVDKNQNEGKFNEFFTTIAFLFKNY